MHGLGRHRHRLDRLGWRAARPRLGLASATLGIVAGWAMVALGLSYYGRRWIGAKRWRAMGQVLLLSAGFLVLVIISAFFPIVINVMQGVLTVDASFLHMARSFGAGQLRIFGTIVLPATVPFLASGLQLGGEHLLGPVELLSPGLVSLG